MYKKILVPLDGSVLAEQALDPALQLAKPVSGELLLIRIPMHVGSHNRPISPAQEYAWPQETYTPIKGESAEYLRDLRSSRAVPGVSIRTMVIQGDRAGTIVDTALSEQVDLIIMSTHGRTGLSRWVLGSVTSRVLRQAPCPVLVLRKAVPLKHVMITLDGSLLAEQAIQPGIALARACGAKLTLLRVISAAEDIIEGNKIRENVNLGTDDPNQQLIQAARNYLRDFVAIHDTGNLEVELAVWTGVVAPTILDFAAQENVDLIAMTTHGRTGFRRWIYGSVTENILYGTDCAVLIIRPPEN
ncbi:MAG: universal stress protein [Candidatus Promineifilaceae bacterium]|nr:universal stress protein [Candidatus Promineifilaceae bacterium]